MDAESIRKIIIFIPLLALSLSIHEYAHAWAANRLGDPTARHMGRLTLNPLVHISWFGTVLLPMIMLFSGTGFLFGWANPVPVEMRNLRKPRLHMALVAAAGPASNIVLAIASTAILAALFHAQNAGVISPFSSLAATAREMAQGAIILNLVLAFFNLIPLPPLDGSRIVQGLVNEENAQKIDQLAPAAQILLLILLVTGGLRYLLLPVDISFRVLLGIFGIS